MKNQRGWIGLGLIGLGIVMLFNDRTESGAWLVMGFGIGMTTTGFQGEKHA